MDTTTRRRKSAPQLALVPPSTSDAPLTETQRNFLATTVAGFRQSFGCDPERFEILWDDDGEFFGVECTGMVDAEGCAV